MLHAKEHADTRGAAPELTVAKHQLRDWIESQLPPDGQLKDTAELVRNLTTRLKAMRPLPGIEDQDGFWNAFGEIGIRLHRDSEFLVIATAFGILCGADESAYIYRWRDGRWRRLWETEQNSDSVKEYRPQIISSILISPFARNAPERLVLTLGFESWCSSAWHPVFYRLWRIASDLDGSKLLLERSDMADIANDPPISGSVGTADALVQFYGWKIGSLRRAFVRHYRVVNGTVHRVDPAALSPSDFVDEWLTQPWTEIAAWSDDASVKALQEWHQKLHQDFISGEFGYPTMHCRQRPDLWQVSINFADYGEPELNRYFLVRWRPPYRFTMFQISEHPSPDCTEHDPEADQPHTLFPSQSAR